jgi:hypothetical protein
MPQTFTRSRADMEKHIGTGGSVQLPDGRIVTRVEDLPAESELAAGDEARLQAEVDRLQAAHDDSARQLDAAKRKLAETRRVTRAAAPRADAGADQGGQADAGPKTPAQPHQPAQGGQPKAK